jgi:RNA polymerase sigma-70 factor (ECF subfamily)
MDELSEKDLILAAILGDLRAFDQLALQYRSALLIIASRIVPIEESEDVVQEALVRAFHALPSLLEPAKFGSWIHSITRNCALQYHRKEKKGRSIMDWVILSEYLAADPANVLEEMESEEAVLEAVESLKPKYQVVVRLYYWGQMPQSKIAKFLNLPLTTIKWRLHEAKTQLKQLLIQRGY